MSCSCRNLITLYLWHAQTITHKTTFFSSFILRLGRRRCFVFLVILTCILWVCVCVVVVGISLHIYLWNAQTIIHKTAFLFYASVGQGAMFRLSCHFNLFFVCVLQLSESHYIIPLACANHHTKTTFFLSSFILRLGRRRCFVFLVTLTCFLCTCVAVS